MLINDSRRAGSVVVELTVSLLVILAATVSAYGLQSLQAHTPAASVAINVVK